MTFQKGDYVATEGLSDDEYEAIACAMRDAGATKGGHNSQRWQWYRYVGWHPGSNGIYHADNPSRSMRLFTREKALEMARAPQCKDLIQELRDASVELDQADKRYKAALQRVTDSLPAGHAILVE